MFKSFEYDLKKKKENHIYRKPTQATGIDFTSNDYLDLSSETIIRTKMIEALNQNVALSSKASRLLSGNHPLHEKLEERLKKFTNHEAALVFSSGYLCNVGVLSLLSKGRTVFSDELNHASIVDGVRLSRSPYFIYTHNDLNALESILKTQKGDKLIVTEGLFSMTGDFSPLEDLSFLALKYNSLLLVDEAHSTGLFGKTFGGRVSDLQEKDHIITIHTCGKALGSFGAFVSSSSLIKDYLINNCRTFIYTTALPPLLMVQWEAALDVLEREPARPLELRKKSYQFRKELNSLFPIEITESPIVPVILGSSLSSMHAAEFLQEKGFDVRAIRYPTVPKNKERLRIILRWKHTSEQLEQFKKALELWKTNC